MSNLTSLLTLHQPAEKTVAWAMRQLTARGYQVERTFDLHAARMSQEDCPCPYHGTTDCSCQMVVLLVHDRDTQPGTIVVHGHDEQTSLSLVDSEDNVMAKDIRQALLPVMEKPEI